MGIIRLNKVTKECNVGLQTAVEFLQKKGFSDVEANPNAKISQEQYDLLVAEFKNDQGLRRDAEQLSIKRQNNKENNKSPFVHTDKCVYVLQTRIIASLLPERK